LQSKLHNLRFLIYLSPIIVIVGGYGLLIVATGEAYPFTVVTGTSMRPTILPGTVALIDQVPFQQLKTGNVIVFTPELARVLPCDNAPSASLYQDASVPCFVIHRIVKIQYNSEGNEILTTKGDANPASISMIDTNISETMYMGKVVLQIPLAGYLTQRPYNEYVALAIFGIILGEFFYDRNLSSREKRLLEVLPHEAS
jgi:signal peptidase I